MLMRLSVADPYTTTVWHYCENSTYTNGSAFQMNLNKVLESLVLNVSTAGFNTSSVNDGQNSNSTVYGLAQCRGDLNSSDCKQCSSMAKARLVKGCNKTSGFIQLDGCLLRYDNYSFYSDYSDSAKHNLICNGNSNNQSDFGSNIKVALLKIAAKAADSPNLFAADSAKLSYNLTQAIYSFAQCWRDLSPTNCGACLSFATEKIRGCAAGALGSQFESVNCYLRCEIYPFFNPSIPSPSPSPSPSQPPPPLQPESPPVSKAKTSNVLRITLGVVAATVGLIAAICLCKRKFFSRPKRWEHISRTGGDEGEISLSETIANPELIFKYDILREATSNFNAERKLGEGGFGSVFRGDLPDGRQVAVKRLKKGSSQGDAEFLNEANLISRVQHRNLVKLLGCSVENSERILVYEYLQNSSLDNIIFDITKRHLLDWRDRYEIIVGTARGLAYLHEESEIRIIHRDIKASNVLLDNKNRPKIADFGLARLFEEDKSHVTTKVAGTFGYMAPEYALYGQLTEKADVFSFGVLVLEIISGRKNQSLPQDTEFLIQGTWRLYNEERALEVMDPTLEGSYSWEEGIRVIQIGLLCIQAEAVLRPSMSRVVSMLTSETEHLPSPTGPAFINLASVSVSDRVKRGRGIDPDKTSSSTATLSTTPSDIHSSAVDPSSIILEPR